MTRSVFRHVALMGRSNITGVSETLSALKAFLKQLSVDIYIEENTADLMDTKHTHIIPDGNTPEDVDLLIVVGGDGSLLHAAHMAIQSNLPVLGIHHGRLGFLTDIHPDNLNEVGTVLKGEYHEEQRAMLTMRLEHNKKVLATGLALNDVALLPGNTAQMITFDTYIDNEFVNEQRADGLIIATPTGSTAYALSGGGPILHPGLDAFEIVPMFPHTLSARPLVVRDTAHIEIRIADTNTHSPCLSCDGFNRVEVPPGSIIHIEKHHTPLKLIHPTTYNYYTTLREKLGWTRHARRK